GIQAQCSTLASARSVGRSSQRWAEFAGLGGADAEIPPLMRANSAQACGATWRRGQDGGPGRRVRAEGQGGGSGVEWSRSRSQEAITHKLTDARLELRPQIRQRHLEEVGERRNDL